MNDTDVPEHVTGEGQTNQPGINQYRNSQKTLDTP